MDATALARDLEEWKRRSPYCLNSRCGWYWIARAKVGEDWKYTLFKSPMVLIGTYDSVEDAKAKYKEIT